MNSAIDVRSRRCTCGHHGGLHGEVQQCADTCMVTFTMQDYPPGYFAFKYQVKSGSAINTCPNCELTILEQFVRDAREQDPLTISARMQRAALAKIEDIELLRTGKIVSNRHREQAVRTHGERT